MEVHGYNSNGSIDVTINEIRMTVPDDMSNRDRRTIAEWEEEGNTIPPYTPPPPSASDVEEEYARRAAAGKVFPVTGYGNVALEGSLRTQTVLLALKDTARDLHAAGVEAPVLVFTDRDNVDHQLTPSQTMELVDAGKLYMQQLHEAKRQLKMADPVPENYADDSNWPSI